MVFISVSPWKNNGLDYGNSWSDVMRRMSGKGDLVKVGTNFPLMFQSLWKSLTSCRGMAASPAIRRLFMKAKEKGGSSAAFLLFGGKLGLKFPRWEMGEGETVSSNTPKAGPRKPMDGA